MTLSASRILLALFLTLAATGSMLALASNTEASEFEAASYPATVHGSGKVGVFKLGTSGGQVECQNGFHSSLKEVSSTLRVAVTWSECKAWGLINATVNPEGCEYVLHSTEATSTDNYKAHLDLDCASGKSIKISVLNCAAEYKSQTGMSTVKLIDDTAASPVEDVTVKPEVTGVKYTVTKDGIACPLPGLGERSDGEIITAEGENITLTGKNPSTEASIGFRVADTAAKHKHEEETAEKKATHEEETAATIHEEWTKVQTDTEHAEHTLATANPEASQFTAGKYPAIVHGSSSAGVLTLNTEAGALKCANTYFAEAAAASWVIDVIVLYESCSIAGIGAATVNTEGCAFRVHAIEDVGIDEYTGRLTVKCEFEESIKITAGTCAAEIKEQGPLASVKLIDDTSASPVENVTFKPEVTGLKYTVTADGAGCPFSGTGTKTGGELSGTSNITLTAQSPSKPSEKIAFRVGEHKDLTHQIETEEAETGPRFKAAKYPATIHGSGSVGIFTFMTNGGKIECQNGFHGNLAEATTVLSFAVTYSECKAFGVLGATVNPEGCEFAANATEKVAADNFKAHLDFVCPAGKSLKVSVITCAAEYKPQSNMTTVELTDDTAASPVRDITLSPKVTGVKYTVTKDGIGCPLNGTGEKSDGEISSSEGITLTGQNPSKAEEKIAIEVG